MKFSVAAGYQPKNSEISENSTHFGKFWTEIKPGNDEDFGPETDFRRNGNDGNGLRKSAGAYQSVVGDEYEVPQIQSIISKDLRYRLFENEADGKTRECVE